MKRIYFILVMILIALLSFVLVNCTEAAPEEEEKDSPLLGGWVYCDSSYTPRVDANFNDYRVLNITGNDFYYGYIDSLTSGNFYWDSAMYHSSEGTYDKGGTTYSLGDTRLLISSPSSTGGYNKFGYEFQFNADKTTAELRPIYTSDGVYLYASGASYVSKLTDFTDQGILVKTAPAADSNESNDIRTNATAATIGTTYNVNFHTDDDSDWYSFDAVSGTTYTMQLTIRGTDRKTSCTDAYITLYDSNGFIILDSDDYDGTSSTLSEIIWTCTTPGTYYVEAETFEVGIYQFGITSN